MDYFYSMLNAEIICGAEISLQSIIRLNNKMICSLRNYSGTKSRFNPVGMKCFLLIIVFRGIELRRSDL